MDRKKLKKTRTQATDDEAGDGTGLGETQTAEADGIGKQKKKKKKAAGTQHPNYRAESAEVGAGAGSGGPMGEGEHNALSEVDKDMEMDTGENEKVQEKVEDFLSDEHLTGFTPEARATLRALRDRDLQRSRDADVVRVEAGEDGVDRFVGVNGAYLNVKGSYLTRGADPYAEFNSEDNEDSDEAEVILASPVRSKAPSKVSEGRGGAGGAEAEVSSSSDDSERDLDASSNSKGSDALDPTSIRNQVKHLESDTDTSSSDSEDEVREGSNGEGDRDVDVTNMGPRLSVADSIVSMNEQDALTAAVAESQQHVHIQSTHGEAMRNSISSYTQLKRSSIASSASR